MEREADCGIINLWYGNVHGAVLTAYALQCVLHDLGYTSKLISTMPELHEPITEESYKDVRQGGISEQFEAKHLETTSNVYSNKTISELNGKFRFFLTGSDQVFRAEWVDDKFFLDFVELHTPKIAVAASFGTDNPYIYKVRKKKIAYLLNRFNALSVREESGVAICKSLAGKDAEWIIDPVFWITPKDYKKLFRPIRIDRKYCCCYFRDEDDDLRNTVELFAGKKDCNILYITQKTSIEDFLSIIHDAEYVITDSYHGLCFSLIFDKPVYCFYNELRGNARFSSLIKMLGLPEDSFIKDHREDLSSAQPMRCFEDNHQQMKKASLEGRKWIEDALANPGKIEQMKMGKYHIIYQVVRILGEIRKWAK